MYVYISTDFVSVYICMHACRYVCENVQIGKWSGQDILVWIYVTWLICMGHVNIYTISTFHDLFIYGYNIYMCSVTHSLDVLVMERISIHVYTMYIRSMTHSRDVLVMEHIFIYVYTTYTFHDSFIRMYVPWLTHVTHWCMSLIHMTILISNTNDIYVSCA